MCLKFYLDLIDIAVVEEIIVVVWVIVAPIAVVTETKYLLAGSNKDTTGLCSLTTKQEALNLLLTPMQRKHRQLLQVITLKRSLNIFGNICDGGICQKYEFLFSIRLSNIINFSFCSFSNSPQNGCQTSYICISYNLNLINIKWITLSIILLYFY